MFFHINNFSIVDFTLMCNKKLNNSLLYESTDCFICYGFHIRKIYWRLERWTKNSAVIAFYVSYFIYKQIWNYVSKHNDVLAMSNDILKIY